MANEEKEIQVGDNLCFVAKDQFLGSSYKTVAITIADDGDITRIDDFFNSKSFVHAFRADSLQEAVGMANNYILKRQKDRREKLGDIHRDKPKMQNQPGFNSFITDSRDPDNVIQVVPG